MEGVNISNGQIVLISQTSEDVVTPKTFGFDWSCVAARKRDGDFGVAKCKLVKRV
jgi:hypothetical protein